MKSLIAGQGAARHPMVCGFFLDVQLSDDGLGRLLALGLVFGLFTLAVSLGRASTASIKLACPGVGFLSITTPSLAADQDNYCEDWTGVSQPANDLSRAGLELVDLTLANLSGALLIDADLTDANLSGADLIAADLIGAILLGALYDEFTLFPSGNTYDNPPWGLDGGIEPWNAGMIPAPEPSFGLMLIFGAMGLIGLAAMKGGA